MVFMEKIKHCWKCGCEVSYQEYKNIDYIPVCPKCGVQYPEKPKDEALLSIYQDDYLKDRSDENLNRLFNLMSKVTLNVICHKLKCTSSHEESDDVWDKVQWVLEKIIKYYKEKPDFKIEVSFVKYISQVALYPLYNEKEQEKKKKEVSIFASKFNDLKNKNNKKLEDYIAYTDGGLSEIENSMDYDNTKNHLIDESISYIKTVIESLYDYEIDRNSNHSFRNALYMAKLYEYFVNCKTDDKIFEEIKNSLDFNLIKKFNASKEMYKNMLINYSVSA